MRTLTIKEWLDEWFRVYTSEMAESTVNLYRDARRRLNVHFPQIEEMDLKMMIPKTFQDVLNTLGQTYSQSTLRHIKVLYNKAYKTAMANRLVEWNPIPLTRIPKYASLKIVDAMTQEEQRAFEQAAATLPVVDHFALMTFLLTGLRRDELRFLRWEDWNIKERVLHIRKSKSKSGIRNVPLIPEVSLMFTHLSQRRTDNHCPYIFSIKGQQLSKYHLRYICDKTARIAHVSHVTPHILRHSFATRMIERGVDPKSLSVIIGHSNVAFTLNRYVTADQDHLKDQIMLLSRIH